MTDYPRSPRLVIARCWAALACCCLISTALAEPDTSPDTSPERRSKTAKIALLAVADPEELEVKNRGTPLSLLALPGFLVNRKIEKDRAESLTSVFRRNTLNLGKEMTAALSEQLAAAGYVIDVITEFIYLADDPGEIDYAHLDTDAEVILLTRFSQVGLYSGQFSRNFLPRLNFEGTLFTKHDQAELFYHYVYYGADAGKANENQIPSDPKYAYPSYGEAYERDNELVEGFRVGIQKIAMSFARQLRSKGF